MLLGQSPFKGDDEDDIFDAILEDEPLYPMSMPGDAVSLLTKVCTCECVNMFAVDMCRVSVAIAGPDPSSRLR